MLTASNAQSLLIHTELVPILQQIDTESILLLEKPEIMRLRRAVSPVVSRAAQVQDSFHQKLQPAHIDEHTSQGVLGTSRLWFKPLLQSPQMSNSKDDCRIQDSNTRSSHSVSMHYTRGATKHLGAEMSLHSPPCSPHGRRL